MLLKQCHALAAFVGLLVLLSGCDRRSEGVSPTVAQPLAATSGVASPRLEGPVQGGLRGGPFAGTVEELAPLVPYDFIQEEYFFSGQATSRDHDGVPTGRSAGYTSRMLVQRPRESSRFNGTVLVEWFNNTAEVDQPPLWGLAHDVLLRQGYAYVGVSAQSVGVNTSPLGLKYWDPIRYLRLKHPGEPYEFDIFSQAARAIVAPDGPPPLGNLVPKRLIAGGESQSAGLLISYANNVQPEARVFDGFFIHTWPGPISTDVGVPVLMLLTEGELEGFTSPLGLQQNLDFLAPLGDIPGLGSLRLPSPKAPADDHAKLRVWEISGGSHFDQQGLVYILAGLTRDLTAPLSLPVILTVPAICLQQPNKLDLARPTMAAFVQLDQWIASGNAPPSMPRIMAGADGHLLRDTAGFVGGGISMPNYEVPLGLNRGDGCLFFGSFEPFTEAELLSRYGNATEFRRLFARSAERNVGRGTLLRAEAQAYLEEAEREIETRFRR